VTGVLVIKMFGYLPDDELFKDDDFWHLPYASDDSHLVLMPPIDECDHEHHDADHEEFIKNIVAAPKVYIPTKQKTGSRVDYNKPLNQLANRNESVAQSIAGSRVVSRKVSPETQQHEQMAAKDGGHLMTELRDRSKQAAHRSDVIVEED
jgi:hypothetical protein